MIIEWTLLGSIVVGFGLVFLGVIDELTVVGCLGLAESGLTLVDAARIEARRPARPFLRGSSARAQRLFAFGTALLATLTLAQGSIPGSGRWFLSLTAVLVMLVASSLERKARYDVGTA